MLFTTMLFKWKNLLCNSTKDHSMVSNLMNKLTIIMLFFSDMTIFLFSQEL